MKDQEMREAGPPQEFDNTMITSYLSCPRKKYWWWRGLDFQITPSYFIWGRAWGATLNSWHGSVGEEKIVRIANALNAGKEIFMEQDGMEFTEGSNDTEKNLENTFIQYTEVYGEEEPWEQMGSELGFNLPIKGTEIFYAGSIDAYIHWKKYGLFNREDKSTGGYITQGYLESWKHSSQVSGYYWGLRQILEEEPFGVLMNIASKRPRKEPDLRFQRSLEQRSEWQIEKFISETVKIADMIRGEWDTWLWPKWGERDPYECAGGPGKAKCLYRRLCLMEMEPWELEESYDFSQEFQWRKGKWTPWERKGSDKEES